MNPGHMCAFCVYAYIKFFNRIAKFNTAHYRHTNTTRTNIDHNTNFIILFCNICVLEERQRDKQQWSFLTSFSSFRLLWIASLFIDSIEQNPKSNSYNSTDRPTSQSKKGLSPGFFTLRILIKMVKPHDFRNHQLN